MRQHRRFHVGPAAFSLAAVGVLVANDALAHDSVRRIESATNYIIGKFNQAENYILTADPAGDIANSCMAMVEPIHSQCENECAGLQGQDRRDCNQGCDDTRDGIADECNRRVAECKDNAKGIHLAALAVVFEDDNGDGEPDGLAAMAGAIQACGFDADIQHQDCADAYGAGSDDAELCEQDGDAQFERCATEKVNELEDLAQMEQRLYDDDADTCEAATVEDFGDECVLVPEGVVPEAALMTDARFGPDEADFVQRDDPECSDRALEINAAKWTTLAHATSEIGRLDQAVADERAARIDADAREANARAQGDAELRRDLNQEIATRQSEVARVDGRLNAEEAARRAGDADLDNRKVNKTALDSVDCGGDTLVEGFDSQGVPRCKGPYQRKLFGFDTSGSGPTCPAGTVMVGVADSGDVQCGQSGSGISALQNFNQDAQTSCTAQCSRSGFTVCDTENYSCQCHNFRCNDHQCNCHTNCWRRRWRRHWSGCWRRGGGRRWSDRSCRAHGNWSCSQRCSTCHDHCHACNNCRRAFASHQCGDSCTTPTPVASCNQNSRTALAWCIAGGWAGGKSCSGSTSSTACADQSSCDTGVQVNQGQTCCSVRSLGCSQTVSSAFVRALCIQAI